MSQSSVLKSVGKKRELQPFSGETSTADVATSQFVTPLGRGHTCTCFGSAALAKVWIALRQKNEGNLLLCGSTLAEPAW